ncbi:MAG TPA: hypothetical protein VGK04_06775 [Thermoanaerobaculia bacterium]|jgi:hypothetical protein
MRTTLSLDDDVARQLEHLQREKRTSWKLLINEVLRRGLAAGEMAPKKSRPKYRTRPVSAGRLLIPTLDDVANALEIAEGERHR